MRFLLLSFLMLTAACRRPTATTPPAATPPAQLTDYSRYVRQGVSFVAVGSNPSWSVTIQPDRQMTFGTPVDSAQVATPPERRTGKGERTYEDANGKLRVGIRPASYTDPGSGRVFSQAVEVRVKQDNGSYKTYRGGGVSLDKLLLLNDIWVLTTLDGEAIKPASPRNAVPRLEMQLGSGRVTGTGGCNRLSGPLRADDQFVKLGPLASTRMACPGGADQLEARFLKALDGTLAYQIDKGVLTLNRDGKAVMTFKKVD